MIPSIVRREHLRPTPWNPKTQPRQLLCQAQKTTPWRHLGSRAPRSTHNDNPSKTPKTESEKQKHLLDIKFTKKEPHKTQNNSLEVSFNHKTEHQHKPHPKPEVLVLKYRMHTDLCLIKDTASSTSYTQTVPLNT